MAGSLAWEEVEKSVKESKSRQGGGGRRLFLDTDQPTEIRFIGLNGKEPYIYKRHYDAKTKRYIVCAEDEAKEGKHEGCVVCMLAKTLRGREARVKSPQRLYAVTVFDPRKYHYVESKPEGEQYQPCTKDDEGQCRWCKRGIERKINGVRHWSMAEQVIMQLRTFEKDVLGKKCARDGGRIKVVGYQCPTCETEMEPDDPTEEIRCIACEKEMGKKPVLRKPKEVISCKTCGPKARRISLADAWITITKTGQKQSTSYNFNPGETEPFDPEDVLKEFPDLKKIKAIKFSAHPDFQPDSAGEQAAILGVKNPFKATAKADEEEDDDDDDDIEYKGKKRKPKDEDDDEDDDDAPKKKRRPAADDEDDDEDDAPKKKKKRSRDDDDDDEDADGGIFD